MKLHYLVLERKEFHSTLSDPTVPSSSITQESLFVLTLALEKFKKKNIESKINNQRG